MDNLTAKEEFYAEHGDWVRTPEGPVYFADGAVVSEPNSQWSQMHEPNADLWNRSKVIARYWEIVANAAIDQFEAYQNYLKGYGKRQDFWATLYTEEMQLNHLKYLRQQAKRAKAKFEKAMKQVNEHRPFWMDEQDEHEAEQASRKQDFLDRVDAIKL